MIFYPTPKGQATMANSIPVVIASDQTKINVSEPSLSIQGASTQTAIVNNILDVTAGANATDISGYRSISCQVISTGTGGTFIFEQSNDNVNFKPLPIYNSELITGTPIATAITATTSQIIYTIPARCNFIRLRIVTAITGGSIRAFTRYSTETWTPTINTIAQPTAGNLQVTASVSGTPTFTPTGSTGQGASTYSAIISNATNSLTQIKSGATTINSIDVSNNSATPRYLKVFNALSASVIMGTTNANLNILIPPNSSRSINCGAFGIRFATGFTIAITGGIANNDNTATGTANEVIVTSTYF
jgi:hypothetical protein